MPYHIAQYRRPDELNRYLVAGIVLSILIHILIVIVISRRDMTSKVPVKIIDVSFVPPLNKSAFDQTKSKAVNQIVTPPDTKNESDNLREDIKRFLSDHDNTVEKEQIKRGDDPNAGPIPGKAAPPAAMQDQAKQSKRDTTKEASKREPQTNKANEVNQPHHLGSLRLDDKTLLEKFSANNKKQEDPNSSNQNPAGYQAFTRPPGSGAAILGVRGSNDFLPNLPDGDITLLNTKATQYAVFVRRVATQVFGQLRRSGWETLQASDILRIEKFSTVRATLDEKGNLIRISIEDSSGSIRFDEVVAAAVKAGARDPNPPEGAKAHDGLYHFIFKSQSWTRMAHNARSGAPHERRWLLLATGLE